MLLQLEADLMIVGNLLKGGNHAASHVVATTKMLSATIAIRKAI